MLSVSFYLYEIKSMPKGFCIGGVDANSGAGVWILETACRRFLNTCARKGVKALIRTSAN